jgi:hypothetical protein
MEITGELSAFSTDSVFRPAPVSKVKNAVSIMSPNRKVNDFGDFPVSEAGSRRTGGLFRFSLALRGERVFALCPAWDAMENERGSMNER